MSENETPQTPPDEHELPPVHFEELVYPLVLQAEAHLGLLGAPEGEEKPKPNFIFARRAIDLLALLQEKTQGKLTYDEQRFLDNSLTELRFRYLHVLEESKKSA